MSVDELRSAIRSGATVRMGFAGGARVWWLDHPYAEVDDAAMRAVLDAGNGAPLLDEAGDCLFGWKGNSQTWISVYA